VPAGTCAGTGTGCHDVTDLAELHATSGSGGAPAYPSCYNADPSDPAACHSVTDTRPTQVADPAASCGEGTTGCHTDKNPSNHGSSLAHGFSAASDYDNTAIAGCTNSGAGCHGSETTYANFSTYHPSSGCTGGACHTSTDKDAFSAAYSGDATCADCHDANYSGAPDVVALASASPDGHYTETTHTASSLDATVSAGGTNTATCVDCHSANVAVSAVVTSDWASRDCASCHNASALPLRVQHGPLAPPVVPGAVGTYQGANCTDAGCHAADLHSLHKDAAGGCALAGCHDYSLQAAKPTATSCGTGADCHTTGDPHPNADHSATAASAECLDCHTQTDVSVSHPDCATCHGNPAYTALPTGKTPECLDCHNGTDVGAHPYSPIDPNHYDETTHTPSAPATFTAAYQSTGADGTVWSGGEECAGCHSDSLAAAHASTSSSGGSVACVECHTDTTLGSAGVVAGDWTTDRCTDCHDTGAATTHDATATTSPTSPSSPSPDPCLP
jgi:hypothetical protein